MTATDGSTGVRPSTAVQRDWIDRTVAEIAQSAYRESPGVPPNLDGTAAALSLLTYDAMSRLVTFLKDLSQRPPLSGSVWLAHREAIEALIADLEKHRVALYYDELHEAQP